MSLRRGRRSRGEGESRSKGTKEEGSCWMVPELGR